MTTAKTLAKPSTRHHVVNQQFATLLEEDFGIPNATILSALDGEPKKAASALCEWASHQDEPVRTLLAWACKYHQGRCRPGRRPSRKPRDARRGTRDNSPERRGATTPPDGGSFRLRV